MALKTRMINPGPSTLMIVNPTGGKSMRKRKSSRRGKTTARRTTNPITKRRRVTRRRRYSNPGLNTGLIFEGVTLAAGGGLTQFVTGMVPPIGGVSPLADAARTAGIAYLLGIVANKVGLNKFSRQITLGGMAVAGGKLINSFLMPFASNVFSPRQAPAAVTNGNGVKGIAMRYPGMNPYGLNGIAVQTPGLFPFGDYAPEMSN